MFVHQSGYKVIFCTQSDFVHQIKEQQTLYVAEFDRDYATQASRVALAELFDLFLVHPAVVINEASKLVPFPSSNTFESVF